MARTGSSRRREDTGSIRAPVSDSATIGSTPGAPNIKKAPTQGRTRVLTADPRREYIAGQGLSSSWYLNLARSLPAHVDDLGGQLDDHTLNAMMRDPQVAACVNVFKASVLETGPQFTSCIDDEDDPDYDRAAFLADWCTKLFGDLRSGIDDVLWSMADAFFLGNKVAELIYDYSDQYHYVPARKPKGQTSKPIPVRRTLGGDGPQLILTDIKVKPRESTGFLVDGYMNIIGILGLIPGTYYPIMPGMVYTDISSIPNLLPADKFAILTFRPKDSDPRGVSILTPAYTAWFIKEQLWSEYGKFLSQMAGGMLVGKPDPKAVAEPIQDANGQPTAGLATPEDSLLQTLLAARNGAALVVQPGADVAVHFPTGDGSAFLEGFQLLNLEITKGILHVTLATEEGKHQARAAAEVHQDVLGILIRAAKGSVERLIRDICRRMIAANYGDDAARLAPTVGLGELQSADQSKLWVAIAQLMTAGYFAQDQLGQVDALAGLPVRLPADETILPDGTQQPAAAADGGEPPIAGAAPQPVPAGGTGPRTEPHLPDDGLHPQEEPIPSGSGRQAKPGRVPRGFRRSA